jgi:RNA polymerase sigma factor (sigma-70 family)
MPRDSARQLRDDELIRRYVDHRDRGDREGAAELWEQLALRNYDRVVQLVKAFRFDGGGGLAPDDVPDAGQEAYLRVVAMGANFRESHIGQFRAALLRCVQNACLDFGRKALRHDKHAGGSLDERYDGDAEAGPYDAAIARHSLEREALQAETDADDDSYHQAQELVAWAIAQVENENYRAVLELTYVERLSGEEIAERLGISHDNVYARRSRGLKRLEEILRDHRS